LRHELVEAGKAGQRVHLKVRDGEGSLRNVEVDFVIAGTGYDVDVRAGPANLNRAISGISA
jgi:lysine/ornithine N-monooxygenase